MGDHQRPDAAPALVEEGEDDAHHQVADEAADALVEVVRAAQHRAGQQGGDRAPAELFESAQQIADHDHLLQDRVLGRREDQHGELPPLAGQRLRDDGEVHAGGARDEVEGESRAADAGRQSRAPGQVEARPGEVEADRTGSGALPRQQVEDEQHGHQGGRDTEELPGQIQPRTPRRRRGVEIGRLVLQSARPGDRADETDQGGDGARPQRQRQHDQRFVPEHPS